MLNAILIYCFVCWVYVAWVSYSEMLPMLIGNTKRDIEAGEMDLVLEQFIRAYPNRWMMMLCGACVISTLIAPYTVAVGIGLRIQGLYFQIKAWRSNKPFG